MTQVSNALSLPFNNPSPIQALYIAVLEARLREETGCGARPPAKGAVAAAAPSWSERSALLPFQCPSCPRRYTSRQSVTRHHKHHHQPTTRCQQCGVNFTAMSVLALHAAQCSSGASS